MNADLSRTHSRLSCEKCSALQPADATPADLCTQCASPIRLERRCHWCVAMTPNGKFCRSCGSEQVPHTQYGAARWLKHLGTDQFTIPARLAAMPADQIDHFSRLYQQQEIVAARQIDDVRLAEKFLHHRGWADGLIEWWMMRLPMAEAELAPYASAPPSLEPDEDRLFTIRSHSPFALSRLLAAVARIRIWQASDVDYVGFRLAEDVKLAAAQLKCDDPALRLEIALALSHWTFAVAGGVFGQREIEAILQSELPGPLGERASTHLALLMARARGVGQPVPLSVLSSEDSDLAFTAALANYRLDPLFAALRIPARRFVAALTLTKAKVDFDLATLLPDLKPHEVQEILYVIAAQKNARPDLSDFFRKVVALHPPLTADVPRLIREIRLLGDFTVKDAVSWITERPDPTFISSLLRAPGMRTEYWADVCRKLVELGLFDFRKISKLDSVLHSDLLPLRFVPAVFGNAPDAVLNDLGLVIRRQLAGHRLAQTPEWALLHAFLRDLKWDTGLSAIRRNWANEILVDLYRGSSTVQRAELTFHPSFLDYFVSPEEFVREILQNLEHPETLAALKRGYGFLNQILFPRNLHADTVRLLPPEYFSRLCEAFVRFVEAQENGNLVRESVGALIAFAKFEDSEESALKALADLKVGKNSEEVTRAIAEFDVPNLG